jgi:2',3'-cyclic-nucleotide 2'-phosphodiesterase (5'-nucleotidase family)
LLLIPASASAKKSDPPGQLGQLQLLAFNDYHGHVLPNDAGNVDGIPAGGGQYLAAKLNELRKGNKYSLTVAAGDLIGGSPAFSGLFHDEPSVESLNAMAPRCVERRQPRVRRGRHRAAPHAERRLPPGRRLLFPG